jgi:hypothetical protein
MRKAADDKMSFRADSLPRLPQIIAEPAKKCQQHLPVGRQRRGEGVIRLSPRAPRGPPDAADPPLASNRRLPPAAGSAVESRRGGFSQRRQAMRQGLFLLAAATSSLVAASSAQASHPELVRSYRFVPQRSVLYQSWTDRDAPTLPIPISGTFDLVTGFHHEPPDPGGWLGQFARFENVHAGGPHPIQDYIVDLNQVLNLTGLEGRQLPLGAPWDGYEFTGKNADGASVRLFASVIGPWFRVQGEATPPPGSTLLYQFQAIARQRPYADFNDDGFVDASDFKIWSANVGASSLEDDITHLGDADGDRDVDGSDYLAWQQQLGEKTPEGSRAAAGGVPEPAGAALIAAAAVLARLVLAGAVSAPRRSARRRDG